MSSELNSSRCAVKRPSSPYVDETNQIRQANYFLSDRSQPRRTGSLRSVLTVIEPTLRNIKATLNVSYGARNACSNRNNRPTEGLSRS